MLDFRIGRGMTDDEAMAVSKALEGVGGGFFSPIATKTGFRLLNVPEYSGVDNISFKSLVSQALEQADLSTLPDEMHLYSAQAESGYLTNDWKASPHGEDYRATIAGLGRPDVARTADELYAALGPKIAAVEDDFAKRYGWHPDVATRFWQRAETDRQAGTVDSKNQQYFIRSGNTLHLSSADYTVRASKVEDKSSPEVRSTPRILDSVEQSMQALGLPLTHENYLIHFYDGDPPNEIPQEDLANMPDWVITSMMLQPEAGNMAEFLEQLHSYKLPKPK